MKCANFLQLACGRFTPGFSPPAVEADATINLLMTDCVDVRPIFNSKMTFRLCRCCFPAHACELLLFMSPFDLTGRSIVERNGENNQAPNAHEVA